MQREYVLVYFVLLLVLATDPSFEMIIDVVLGLWNVLKS